MKLARQFDEYMKQDKETQLKIVNNTSKYVNHTETKVIESSVPENVLQVLTLDEEAELHALFDSSTQKVSGRFSQGSIPSTWSLPTEKESCDDFDDDWENDDLLKDSLSITHNSEQHSATTKADILTLNSAFLMVNLLERQTMEHNVQVCTLRQAAVCYRHCVLSLQTEALLK